MPCKSKRAHTPIVSEKQRRFFGAEYGRAKRGLKTRSGMSKSILRQHLLEVSGKKLPETSKSKSRRGK